MAAKYILDPSGNILKVVENLQQRRERKTHQNAVEDVTNRRDVEKRQKSKRHRTSQPVLQ